MTVQAETFASQNSQQEEFDVKVQTIEDARFNPLVVAQLSKTKMCTKFARGACKDPNCGFAHSKSELRSPLDLSKTAMCRLFAKGQCGKNDCRFAHSEEELRATAGVYKTQLCNFHSRGHCKKGKQCRHAHGDHELRGCKQVPSSPTDSESTRCPSDDSGDTSVTNDWNADSGTSASDNVSVSRLLAQKACYRPEAELREWSLAASAATVNPQFAKSLQVPTIPRVNAPTPSEPMKITLPSLAKPVLEPLPHNSVAKPQQRAARGGQTNNQAAVANWQFGTLSDFPTWQPHMIAQTNTHRGGDRLTDVSSDQIAVAAQVAKAAELELQAAMMKAHFQIKHAAEIASTAAKCHLPLAMASMTDSKNGPTAIDMTSMLINRAFSQHLGQLQRNGFLPPAPGFRES